jgi:hypothetical protein
MGETAWTGLGSRAGRPSRSRVRAPAARVAAALVATVVMIAGLGAGSATAQLVWSRALPVDTTNGLSLVVMACASPHRCVAIDNGGRAVSFDPSSPRPALSSVLSTASSPVGLACPSSTQCTAIDPKGNEVTFDPTTLIVSSSANVDPVPLSTDPTNVNGLACPSTSQCVAVDGEGRIVTFTPGSPTAPTATTLDPGEDFGLVDVICVSAAQCTAISQTKTVTFNPAAPAGATPAPIVLNGLLGRVACPSTTQCTAVDSLGNELTYNPLAPASPTKVSIDHEFSNGLLGIACPVVTQCTAVSAGTREITFNPQSGAVTTSVAVDPSSGGNAIGQDSGIQAIVCASASACSAVDGNGQLLSFDPTAPGHPALIRIDSGSILFAVSCPSRDQCTATGERTEVTFHPVSRRSSPPRVIFRGLGLAIGGVACPLVTICSAVDVDWQVTFNPQRPRFPRRHSIDPSSDIGLTDLRCPSQTECVAIDGNGGAVSYNPRSAALIKRNISPEHGEGLVALGCSSAAQCTAVDNFGTMGTFQPRTGRSIATAKIDSPVGLDAPSGDSSDELDGVACPTLTLCVAVDTLGNAVSFNPRSSHGRTPVAVDPGHALTAIACPSRRGCVAVDSAGRAFVGSPLALTHWTVHTVPGAIALHAISCVSARECVAVDDGGNAFLARAH